MKLTVLISSILFLTNVVENAKILGVFPTLPRSHYILGSALMRSLAERGHDVTVISAYGEKDYPKNGTYRDVVLTGVLEVANNKRRDMNIFEKSEKPSISFFSFVIEWMLQMTEQGLNHTNVQKLLHSQDEFDVVIVEQFMNEAHKAFATHFKAPLILFTTIGANSWVNPLVGNPQPLSYIPDTFLSYTSDMTFYERTVNTLVYLFSLCLNHFYIFPQQNKLVQKYFPNIPHLNDIMYNTSILLLNSHPSFSQPVPYVPNMIDIGGFHIKPHKKLPEDLKQFLDTSTDGVIYFSLGSNLRSVELPVAKRLAFLKTFSKLKVQVLWKWEDDVLPEKPPNVKIGKWFPQQDILAHPNVKLFITHGGLLSTTETIYHGVPVLAIPVTADQNLNAQKIVLEGFGLSLSYKDVTEDTLTKTLAELLNNSQYAQTAKKKSKIFHDRPVSAMETAIYWVEYVIRHRGAPHLRVSALDLPWYKYHLLDVICFIFVLNLLILFCFYIITRKVCLLCRQKKMKLKTN